jgi:hypothetical protein
MESLMFPKDTYVSNLFAITIISFLFLYIIAPYHWKDFENNYNFIDGNISIRIPYAKITIKQKI